jgi:hypothetical protein
MSRIKPLSRRHFSKSLAIAAGALAGSTLIQPRRVRAENDGAVQVLADNAAANLDYWAYSVGNLGVNPLELNWYEVQSAITGAVAAGRQFGLDQIIESQYGVDSFLTQAWDWAWQEGGWNPFWALSMFGISGLTATWFANHPEWGQFARYRTGWPTSTWISGEGPLSSQIPGVAGWMEVPLWPASFHVGPNGCKPEDDGICATGGGMDYPYYDIYNSYVPGLIWTPAGASVIWFPEAADVCRWLGWGPSLFTAIALAIQVSGSNHPIVKAVQTAAAGTAFILLEGRRLICG